MIINTPKLREKMRKNGIETIEKLAEILKINKNNVSGYIYSPEASPCKTDEFAKLLAKFFNCDVEDIANGEEHEIIRKQTLCWECRNAVPNSELGAGCEWSRYFKPVPGWDAKRKDVSMGKNRKTLSYFVVKCPKFERG